MLHRVKNLDRWCLVNMVNSQKDRYQIVGDGRVAGSGVTGDDPGPYTCSVCGQEFAWQAQWLVHCATHSPSAVAKFRCPFCNYGTNDRSNFRRHVIVHTGVKNYICPRCGRRSNDRSNMKKHVMRCAATPPTHTLS
ncbi:gastrula zinc finger protein XlCGF9.1-like [Penaeus vannamei]|uniref:gastrula zinc finger protein XlCGF9.1-like n=1 Tax=Penaeus vannamei TaxID=6689 RepID=UPI00387F42A2